MENQDQSPEEEIVNPKQFQVGRNPEKQEEETNQDGRANNEQAGYTPGETEFADGEGTRLDQESEELETEDEPESNSQGEEEDADFENPNDDPA